jgi:uncharacterized repeat protein (TIGR03803 family)
MRDRKFFLGMTMALAMLALATLTMCAPAAAQTETLLHSFSFSENGKDGSSPYSTLAIDASGDLYGTTFVGGAYNYGAVFEMSPRAGGGWTEKILHSFIDNGRDGQEAYSGVVLDASGNLFGTTVGGGADGSGTVFELSPQEGGGWTEKILHSFHASGGDGDGPYASVVLDGAGNLYGTTTRGGTFGYGTAFEVSPREAGGWTEKILYNFSPVNQFESPLYSSLILDGAGNLYGTAATGGAYAVGAVFELSPLEGGEWTETVLHSFNDRGKEGNDPRASLIFDQAGNLYGTTWSGGPDGGYGLGKGTVFELSPSEGGGWTETVLHFFSKTGPDGRIPDAGVIFDAAGNLYGTTEGGGPWDSGTVYELTPAGGGIWTDTTLYAFQHRGGEDGHFPYGGLVFDTAGNLYGTTLTGGTDGLGTVFEITP